MPTWQFRKNFVNSSSVLKTSLEVCFNKLHSYNTCIYIYIYMLPHSMPLYKVFGRKFARVVRKQAKSVMY